MKKHEINQLEIQQIIKEYTELHYGQKKIAVILKTVLQTENISKDILRLWYHTV